MELEDQHRFQVEAMGWNYDGATVTLACTRCKWYADYDQPSGPNETYEPLTLADLNQRAQEHTEVCR